MPAVLNVLQADVSQDKVDLGNMQRLKEEQIHKLIESFTAQLALTKSIFSK